MNEYEVNKYRKRPVTIRAQRMSEPFTVLTLEGQMHGKAGDWRITGITGEQYPCDDEIFRRTYEVAPSQEDDVQLGPKIWTVSLSDGRLQALGGSCPKRAHLEECDAYMNNESITIREHGHGAVIYRGPARDYDEDLYFPA